MKYEVVGIADKSSLNIQSRAICSIKAKK